MSAFVELPPASYHPDAFSEFSPAGGFSIGTARAMMWACQLSYETRQPQTIEHVKSLWRLSGVSPFIAHDVSLQASFDTRGVFIDHPDAMIVAFAGTDPAIWENLATDFNIPLNDNAVHVGFESAIDAVWADVHEKIKAQSRPLIIAGHSLGAALAVLAAERAHDAGIAPTAVYVFGMPRIGNATFAARYTGKCGEFTYRLVHGQDIVATVPMSKLGFRHIGHMLWCKRNEKFDPNAPLSPLSSDEPQFAGTLLTSIKAGFTALLAGQWLSAPGLGPIGRWFRLLPGPIRDHLPDRYCGALGAAPIGAAED